MAVSSTTTFELTTNEIIADSLRDLGVIGPTREPSAEQLQHGRRLLNALVKSVDPEGAFLWRVNRTEQTLTASTASYSLSTSIMDIDEPMNYRSSSSATTRSPIRPMTRDEYMSLPDRTTTGTPVQYYLEKLLSTITLYLYPVPNTTSSVVEFAAVWKSRDHTTGAVTADFPQPWGQCLRHGLNAELAPSYGQASTSKSWRDLFLAEKAELINADVEHGDIQLCPMGDYYGGDY